MMLTDMTQTSLKKALLENLLFHATLLTSAWIAMENATGTSKFLIRTSVKFIGIYYIKVSNW